MEAGRELDALVAEKVLGVDVYWFEAGKEKIPTNNLARTVVPEYSTEIAEAWELFEHPIFDAWTLGRSAVNGEWEITNPWAAYSVVATAKTAPHAICLAALKAKGIKIS